jgi:hypothetical protein
MPTTEKHRAKAHEAAYVEMQGTHSPSSVADAVIDAYLRSVLEGTEASLWIWALRGKKVLIRSKRDKLTDFIEAQAASLSEAQERVKGLEKLVADVRYFSRRWSRCKAVADYSDEHAALPQALPAQPTQTK